MCMTVLSVLFENTVLWHQNNWHSKHEIVKLIRRNVCQCNNQSYCSVLKTILSKLSFA